jgi:hypothetical protein
MSRLYISPSNDLKGAEGESIKRGENRRERGRKKQQRER